MADYIEPRVLKGFRDFLPAAEIARKNLVEKIEHYFRSYGFVPIDTPALEYAEILLGKGGGETEKQIYRFKDNGDRDVALRFDLTVPFARFLAEHRESLSFPFKRYHIAKVWRGENAQRGRYREFTQCDMDIIGSDSAAADFEILHMMAKTLPAISGGKVIIRLNHRGLFNRFLSRLGVLEFSVDILRAVDKLAKIGREETLALLAQSVGGDKASQILDYIAIKGDFSQTLVAMTAASGPCDESDRLSLIYKYMEDANITDCVELDPSITRGLDYYTGVVFESFLAEMPEIGSICSGGRYDNLVGLYTADKKNALTGVGTSIGIDRLIAGIEALGRLQSKQSYSRTAIACTNEAFGGAYQALADKFREKEIPCEVFLEDEKLTRQFQLAEKKGLCWLIIPDEKDPLNGTLTLRNLSSRENREGLSFEQAVEVLED
ncbi:MAG: histidine--tRNA ligase [Treponema sp.]|jgi:histidyl-tRNA synthetase|nr:histidine--tRNA ligase [Treponema sp.]